MENDYLVCVTLLLMGFFAGNEMAYYSANRLNIELRKKQGGTAGHLLAKFIDAPASFIRRTLIGFNIFLVFLQSPDQLRDAAGVEIPGRWCRPGSYHCRDCHCHFVVLIFAEFIPRAYFQGKE